MEYQRKYNGKPTANKQKGYHRIYSAKIKMMVMEKYGRICKGCGDTDLASLSIDHINQISTADKIKNDGTGSPFYKKLLKVDIRTDLQILCMSCQLRKRFYGPDITLWPTKRAELENEIKDFKVEINLDLPCKPRGLAGQRKKQAEEINHLFMTSLFQDRAIKKKQNEPEKHRPIPPKNPVGPEGTGENSANIPETPTS